MLGKDLKKRILTYRKLTENTYRLRYFLVRDYDNVRRITDWCGSATYVREHHHGDQGMFRIDAHRLAKPVEEKQKKNLYFQKQRNTNSEFIHIDKNKFQFGISE